MGLVYFSDLIKKPPPKDRVYVADTSFLLSSKRAKEQREQKAKQLKDKLLANKNKIVYCPISLELTPHFSRTDPRRFQMC